MTPHSQAGRELKDRLLPQYKTNVSHTSEWPGGLVITLIARPQPQSFWFSYSGWDSRICLFFFFYMFPGITDIQKTKFMASSPITSCQIDGGKMETMADFSFLGSKITADSNFSQEIKKCLLLERKAREKKNLDSVLKSRDIILSTKSA